MSLGWGLGTKCLMPKVGRSQSASGVGPGNQAREVGTSTYVYERLTRMVLYFSKF